MLCKNTWSSIEEKRLWEEWWGWKYECSFRGSMRMLSLSLTDLGKSWLNLGISPLSFFFCFELVSSVMFSLREVCLKRFSSLWIFWYMLFLWFWFLLVSCLRFFITFFCVLLVLWCEVLFRHCFLVFWCLGLEHVLYDSLALYDVSVTFGLAKN